METYNNWHIDKWHISVGFSKKTQRNDIDEDDDQSDVCYYKPKKTE